MHENEWSDFQAYFLMNEKPKPWLNFSFWGNKNVMPETEWIFVFQKLGFFFFQEKWLFLVFFSYVKPTKILFQIITHFLPKQRHDSYVRCILCLVCTEKLKCSCFHILLKKTFGFTNGKNILLKLFFLCPWHWIYSAGFHVRNLPKTNKKKIRRKYFHLWNWVNFILGGKIQEKTKNLSGSQTKQKKLLGFTFSWKKNKINWFLEWKKLNSPEKNFFFSWLFIDWKRWKSVVKYDKERQSSHCPRLAGRSGPSTVSPLLMHCYVSLNVTCAANSRILFHRNCFFCMSLFSQTKIFNVL